jgi:hypothetical protein
MKIGLLGIFILVIVGCDFSSASKSLDEINYSKYISKSVKSLLNDIDEQHTRHIFFDEPPCFLQGAYFLYPDSIVVEIYVNEFKFVEQFDTTRKWNYEGFLKEKISGLIIRKNNKIVNEFPASSDM